MKGLGVGIEAGSPQGTPRLAAGTQDDPLGPASLAQRFHTREQQWLKMRERLWLKFSTGLSTQTHVLHTEPLYPDKHSVCFISPHSSLLSFPSSAHSNVSQDKPKENSEKTSLIWSHSLKKGPDFCTLTSINAGNIGKSFPVLKQNIFSMHSLSSQVSVRDSLS